MIQALGHLVPFTPSSLMYGLGYAVGFAVFCWFASTRKLLTDGILLVACAGLIGGLFGANVLQYVLTGQMGKSILGGIAGGYLTVYLVKRKLGIIRPTGDLFAVGLLAGEAVGRFGCFFAGCCNGLRCDLPWAINEHHPTQIYLSFACVSVLCTVLLVEAKIRPPENTLWYLQGALYCPLRFLIECFRDHPPSGFWISPAQVACMLGLIFFTGKLIGTMPIGAKRHLSAK